MDCDEENKKLDMLNIIRQYMYNSIINSKTLEKVENIYFDDIYYHIYLDKSKVYEYLRTIDSNCKIIYDVLSKHKFTIISNNSSEVYQILQQYLNDYSFKKYITNLVKYTFYKYYEQDIRISFIWTHDYKYQVLIQFINGDSALYELFHIKQDITSGFIPKNKLLTLYELLVKDTIYIETYDYEEKLSKYFFYSMVAKNNIDYSSLKYKEKVYDIKPYIAHFNNIITKLKKLMPEYAKIFGNMDIKPIFVSIKNYSKEKKNYEHYFAEYGNPIKNVIFKSYYGNTKDAFTNTLDLYYQSTERKKSIAVEVVLFIDFNIVNEELSTRLHIYREILSRHENFNVMYNYTICSAFYNLYLFKRIYVNIKTNQHLNIANNKIKDLIYYMSNYNNIIFGKKSMTLYRDEAFYPYKVTDTYVCPTTYSFSLSHITVFERDIKLIVTIPDLSQAKFLLLLSQSNYQDQYEIVFPAGSKFLITNIIKKRNMLNVLKTYIYANYDGIIDYEGTEDFIAKYKANIRITDEIRILFGQGLVHDIVEIQEIDIKEPKKNIHDVIYSKTPDVNSKRAYEGESINYKKKYCIDDKIPIDFLKNDHLKILTFNVHNFVRVCEPSGRNINHFENFMKENNNYDIICLQEIVPINDSFKELVKIMATYGYTKYMITNQTYNTQDPDVIGKYYILCNGIFFKEHIIVENKISYGLFNNRCLQKATVVFNEKKIDVYNIHFEFNINKAINNELVLYTQITQVVDVLSKSTNPFIICGDFNNAIDNFIFEKLKKKTVIVNNINKDVVLTGFNRKEIIDYIAVSSNLYSENSQSYILRSKISDHYAVAGSIDVSQIINNIANINTNIELFNVHKDNIIKPINFKKICSIFVGNLSYEDQNQYVVSCSFAKEDGIIYMPIYNNTIVSKYLNQLRKFVDYLSDNSITTIMTYSRPYHRGMFQSIRCDNIIRSTTLDFIDEILTNILSTFNPDETTKDFDPIHDLDEKTLPSAPLPTVRRKEYGLDDRPLTENSDSFHPSITFFGTD